MCESPEDLNYDCNFNMFLAKTMLTNLNKNEDRHKAVRWMRKLAQCNRSLEEMKLRNDFMYYLVINIQAGELQPPFVDSPPQAPLPTIAHLLPGGVGIDLDKEAEWADPTKGGREPRPLLYENSPDGGEFLAAQPVPRCGAFCYLAVVARPNTMHD